MFKISDWFKLILCTVLSSGVAFGGNFGQMNFAYWQIPPASNPTATYLVVAGGGGGGGGGSTYASEGGGGAGGLLTSTATLTVGTTYTITVGSYGNWSRTWNFQWKGNVTLPATACEGRKARFSPPVSYPVTAWLTALSFSAWRQLCNKYLHRAQRGRSGAPRLSLQQSGPWQAPMWQQRQ